MQKHTWLGVLVASFMILIICPDWYLYSLLSIGVALYLLALGKSHTLNWENKDMSKNLYPPGLECVIFMTTQYFPFTGEYDPCLVPELLLLSPFATQTGPSPCPTHSAFLGPQQSGIPCKPDCRHLSVEAAGDLNCLVPQMRSSLPLSTSTLHLTRQSPSSLILR
jgi:hypothetical protein